MKTKIIKVKLNLFLVPIHVTFHFNIIKLIKLRYFLIIFKDILTK